MSFVATLRLAAGGYSLSPKNSLELKNSRSVCSACFACFACLACFAWYFFSHF
jgi:hypothetical protein